MKLLYPSKQFSWNSDFAFTAVEMVISTTIVMMTVIALVSAEIYGTRVYILAATKLAATDGGRDTMGKIRSQIQSAQGTIDIGNYTWANGSPTNFQMLTNGQSQIGNAIRIQPTTNNTFSALQPYTLIFLQPGNGTTNFAINDSSGHLINTNSLLMETFDTNYNPILTNTLAMYVTNQQVFTAVDFTGTNVMTTYQNNTVFQVTLFFSQWEYPIAVIGTNDINAYDYYRLQSRVCARALND
jgi:hypothetical protein